MIAIKDLHKRFGKNQVLKGIDLDIGKGGIFAVLGPNGSGKTTLIKCILGMVIPNSGDILVDHSPVRNNWKYRSQIDYLPQIANFPGNLTVAELIRMIKNLRGQQGNDAPLVEAFHLEPFLDKRLGNLSGGTKQKVNLVLAFMFNSPLIILDEPTAGLDPVAMLYLKELIHKEREKGKTILITSHIMGFVEEVAEEIVFLLEGRVYFKGNMAALMEKTQQNDFQHAIATLLKENNA